MRSQTFACFAAALLASVGAFPLHAQVEQAVLIPAPTFDWARRAKS